MSTNYHTPIVPGSPADTSTINVPLGELDSALSGLISGSSGLNVLRMVEQEVTIDVGAISRVSALMIVKSPVPSGIDSFTTISGGNDGDLIGLRAYTGHKITFGLSSGLRLLLEDRYTFYVRTSGVWREVSSDPKWIENKKYTTPTRPQAVVVPRNSFTRDSLYQHLYLHYVPSMGTRNWAAIRASGTSFQSIGLPAPTTTGTIANASDDDGNWLSATTGATAGYAAGVASNYTVTRFTHDPRFEIVLKTGPVVTNMRIWAGLFHANPPNNNTLAGAGIGFRWSTVASDPSWMAIVHNGTSQVVEMDTGVSVNPDTIYMLSVRDYEDGAYFCINGQKIGTLPINWPTVSTDLGLAVRVITQTAAARSVLIGRLYVEHD